MSKLFLFHGGMYGIFDFDRLLRRGTTKTPTTRRLGIEFQDATRWRVAWWLSSYLDRGALVGMESLPAPCNKGWQLNHKGW